MSVQDFYNLQVDIERLARTDDSYGSWSESAVKVHTGLACSIQPRRGFEGVVRGKEQSEITHVMYCNVVTLQPEWRVNRGGILYDIIAVRNVATLGRFLAVDLREVVA